MKTRGKRSRRLKALESLEEYAEDVDEDVEADDGKWTGKQKGAIFKSNRKQRKELNERRREKRKALRRAAEEGGPDSEAARTRRATLERRNETRRKRRAEMREELNARDRQERAALKDAEERLKLGGDDVEGLEEMATKAEKRRRIKAESYRRRKDRLLALAVRVQEEDGRNEGEEDGGSRLTEGEREEVQAYLGRLERQKEERKTDEAKWSMYLYQQAHWAGKSAEEKADIRVKRREAPKDKEVARAEMRSWRSRRSLEQKEKAKEALRRYKERLKREKPEVLKEQKDRAKIRVLTRLAEETEEERERRLLRGRIAQLKHRLKHGVVVESLRENLERRLEALVKSLEAFGTITLSTKRRKQYRPRVQKLEEQSSAEFQVPEPLSDGVVIVDTRASATVVSFGKIGEKVEKSTCEENSDLGEKFDGDDDLEEQVRPCEIPKVTTPHLRAENPTKQATAGKSSKKVNNTDAKFQCDRCENQYKSKDTLLSHIRRAHEGLGFYCDLCPRRADFQQAAKLWRHKVEKHGLSHLPPPVSKGTNPIQCEHCGEWVLRRYEAHVGKFHPEAPIPIAVPLQPIKKGREKVACSECGVIIRRDCVNRHMLRAHDIVVVEEKRVPKTPRVACPQCSKLLSWGRLNSHLRVVHGIDQVDEGDKHCLPLGKGRVQCLLCLQVVGRTFFKKHLHQVHLIVHGSLVACSECNKMISRRHLETHVRTVHEYKHLDVLLEKMTAIRWMTRPLGGSGCCVCIWCEDIKFQTRIDWRLHLQAEHSDVYEPVKAGDFSCLNLKCPLCSQNVVGVEKFEDHVNGFHIGGSVAGGSLLKCAKCDKLMQSLSDFEKHAKTAHVPLRARKRRGTNCLRCEREFDSETHLQNHVRKVHPSSFWPCPECGLLKFTKEGRRLHMFQCRLCLNSKSGGKPQQEGKPDLVTNIKYLKAECELCGKSMSLFTLQHHYRVAHDAKENTWRCDKCPREFRWRTSWVAHNHERHGSPLDELVRTASTLNCEDGSNLQNKLVNGSTPNEEQACTTSIG